MSAVYRIIRGAPLCVNLNKNTAFYSHVSAVAFKKRQLSSKTEMKDLGSRDGLKATEQEDEVLFDTRKRTGIITLNRPRQLNTLTKNMVELVHSFLQKHQHSLDVVIIRGAGDRAFCAGGDVVSLARAGRRGDPLPARFFASEYRLNFLTSVLQVPYVALLNGVTMGGGCGVSMHGSYRVCCESTLLAMPETTIGLFPDVGGSHFLSRLPGRLGLFLALSSHRLKGTDVLHAGLASHCCRQQHLDQLIDEIVNSKSQFIGDILDRYSTDFGDTGSFSLQPHLATIDRCFSSDCVATIMDNLKQDQSDFATQVHTKMSSMCPLSMAVTTEQLRRGRHMSLAECLSMEYRLAVRFTDTASCNFYEGVRALLEDKDNRPVWSPDSVDKISDQMVQQYFSPLPHDQELRLY